MLEPISVAFVTASMLVALWVVFELVLPRTEGVPVGRLLAVSALVVALGVGITIAASASPVAAAENGSDVTTADEIEEPEYPLDELRDGGTPLPDAPEGIRSDGQRLWWIEHWPADAVLGDPGARDDTYSEYVGPTTTVERTSVYLRTVAVEDREQTRTVKVAYWREGEREVEDGNVTRTEPFVEDLVVEEREISFRAGMPVIEIPLRTTDEPREVTVWIEDGPRWRFTHDPVATAEPIAVDTVGDFWGLATMLLVVPIVGGLAIGGSVGKRVIARTGKGPGYPIGAWMFAIAFVLGIVLLFSASSITELIGVLPWIVGIAVALIGLIVILESQAVRQRTVEFVRPIVSPVTGPQGSNAVEVLEVERQAETVVDLPSGDPAVVRSGLIPFLARAFGSSATIPSVAFETRIDVDGPDVDELIVVDPTSDDVLDYSAETFVLDPPESREELMRTGAIAGVAGLILIAVGMSISWLWSVLGGAIIGAALLTRPIDGEATVEPAKAHVRSAWVSAMILARDVEDARTLEKARETIIEQQGRGEREIQEAIEAQDATLVEEMLGTDVSRSIREESDAPEIFDDEINDGSESDDDEEGSAPAEAVSDD